MNLVWRSFVPMIEKWRKKYAMDVTVTAGENAMVTEDRQATKRQTVQRTSHGWRSGVKEGGMMLYGAVFHRRRCHGCFARDIPNFFRSWCGRSPRTNITCILKADKYRSTRCIRNAWILTGTKSSMVELSNQQESVGVQHISGLLIRRRIDLCLIWHGSISLTGGMDK